MGALLVASLTGLAVTPVSALDAEPGPSAATSSTLTAPSSPEFDSGTPTTDSIAIAWSWGPEAPAPDGVTSVVVRAEPGGHEVLARRSVLSATLTGLEPDTEY